MKPSIRLERRKQRSIRVVLALTVAAAVGCADVGNEQDAQAEVDQQAQALSGPSVGSVTRTVRTKSGATVGVTRTEDKEEAEEEEAEEEETEEEETEEEETEEEEAADEDEASDEGKKRGDRRKRRWRGRGPHVISVERDPTPARGATGRSGSRAH